MSLIKKQGSDSVFKNCTPSYNQRNMFVHLLFKVIFFACKIRYDLSSRYRNYLIVYTDKPNLFARNIISDATRKGKQLTTKKKRERIFTTVNV